MQFSLAQEDAGLNASAPPPPMYLSPWPLSEAREDCGAVGYGAEQGC